jgi:peptide/nickel transport system substrate-binding protein
VILIDQLKAIYIDGELEPVDTTQWYPRLMRKEFKVGLNITESEVDDPDAQFYENYACGALRNYTGYCNKSVDALIDRQSRETDANKRRRLVWETTARAWRTSGSTNSGRAAPALRRPHVKVLSQDGPN